jgi:hypothetical protein
MRYKRGMARDWLSPGERALLARFIDLLLARAAAGAVASVRVFGSRARGTSHENSDLDVAVFAAPGADRIALRNAAADSAWDAMAERDAIGLRLSPVALPALDADEPPTGLYAAIEREGVTIWPPT